MWIYSLNYARTAIITWLGGRLMWAESHIPLLMPSPWDESGLPGSCSSASAGNPKALALLRCWILALSSMVESCKHRDFVTKSNTLELLPLCWAAKKSPWGSAAPCQGKMLDLEVTLSCKAQEIPFHTGTNKEKEQGNYSVWVVLKLLSHVVFSKCYNF